MINLTKTVGLKNGIVVVIKNSAILKGGKLPKCHLTCERGGKYKSPRYVVNGQSLKKNIGTKKCECPFEQLIKKEYLHNYRTNPDTNEITNILWVYPKSLELSVNFPSVLIIDATYKTNEYRIPLLEVVGITSTMRTYSLMFAYLSNERIEQLTWALDTLKKWMVEKKASLPFVIVSNRDLALINAIETCFPNAHHIICIWHINQCVMKKCAPMLGLEWQRFYASWHSLINSSTQWSYQQKWDVMREEYQRFQGVLKYLWETWLHPYKERFVSAWVDTCIHLGSNSSQRYSHFIVLLFQFYSLLYYFNSFHY